ncbi:MAG: DegT/DnrJ/EryC1/StrS aminotransferase family protein [Candidatus Omnitrophica bacterium]|nr:DegT/DnrJ/EryC1/StrS aminotransferase family protein [Candidatus Omnitrophota bacterium]
MRREFLPLSKPDIGYGEIKAVTKVLKSGYLTTGSKVTEFERAVCNYLGKDLFAVGLNSCTAGLYLSLVASGIGSGDEVIVPTWTFAATAHVVLWTGAKPILCDVEESSLNIDIQKMKDLITRRTKAVIPVHFAGYPCDMDEILPIAGKNGIAIIEDAAHAIGTEHKGRKIGSFGNMAAFSFYATKNLTCGEGGMVVSNNKRIVEKIRKKSYFGINKKAFNRYNKKGSWYYEIEEMGYKYNMDNIHASIGLIQLKRLRKMIRRRRAIADLYKKNLDVRIRRTKDDSQNLHSYHLFTIAIDKKIISRDLFIKKLKQRNIGTSVHFIPLHRHPYYKRLYKKTCFPVADRVYEEILSIPMFSAMSDRDAYYVIEQINDVLKRLPGRRKGG